MFFPETIIRVVKQFSLMNFSQPKLNLSDLKEKYNGWSDWTTWNVALWINNDQGFYSIATVSYTHLTLPTKRIV